MDFIPLAYVDLATEWMSHRALAKRVWKEILHRISGERQKVPDTAIIDAWLERCESQDSWNIFGCILRRDIKTRKVIVYRQPPTVRKQSKLTILINEGPMILDREILWNQQWVLRIKGECRDDEQFILRSFLPRIDMKLCSLDQKTWLQHTIPSEYRSNLFIIERKTFSHQPSSLKFIHHHQSILHWHELTIESHLLTRSIEAI
jgi:hypothetical protein